MRFLVYVTYFMAGLGPILPKLGQFAIIDKLPYVHLVIFLPATLVGSLLLASRPSHRIMLSMTGVVLIMWLGLFWVDDGERGRGLLIFSSVATTGPLAVLIATWERWVLAATAFVAGSTASAFWLFIDWTAQGTRRYGALYSGSGTRVTEQNSTAVHLSFAALLAVILILDHFSQRDRLIISPLLLGSLPILIIGAMLTQSRGALAAFAAALLALSLFSTGGRHAGWRAYFVLVGASWALFALFAVPNGLRDRLLQQNALSLGDRLPIWESAFQTALHGGVRQLLVGAGTGGSDHLLGQVNPAFPGAHLGVDEVYRLNAHNAFIDWFVSHGLLGMPVAMFTGLMLLRWAFIVDRARRHSSGFAMVVFIFVAALSLVVYRLEATSIGMLSITLGYLSSRWGIRGKRGGIAD